MIRLSRWGDFALLVSGRNMRILTSLLPQLMVDESESVDIAVVVDVLRATSVMTTAFESGANQIYTCCEISEAKNLSDRLARANRSARRPLLCGERKCRAIEGFDFGNSPAEYVPETVLDQILVMTTTNGTKAIEAASSAKKVIAASFLNLPKVVDFLRGARTVHVVCAGTDGRITAEDVLLAGAIIDACRVEYQAAIQDDDSQLAMSLWLSSFSVQDGTPWTIYQQGHGAWLSDSLANRFSQTLGGTNLTKLGLGEDLSRCAQIGTKSAIAVRVRRNPTVFELLANH